MPILKRVIDVFTLGSDRPIGRLIAYYVVVALVTLAVVNLFPLANLMFSGERLDELIKAPQLLQDGLSGGFAAGPVTELPPRLEVAISTALILVGSLILMLPVSWVYMTVRRAKGHSQAIVQTLITLPLVVAGIIMVVRNSLALAFALAGVVAAVRFRNNLDDARDAVFIFLAIGVGFAAGVQVMTIAALVSVVFNFVLLLTWRYDYGRNILEPTAAATQWVEPLNELAGKRGAERVPDRDLMLALTPKKLDALAERFDRVRQTLGPDGKKPRYNSILVITTDDITGAQQAVEPVLEETVKAWALDEVVSNDGKPSQVYYLLKIRKKMNKDEVLTAVRAAAGDKLLNAEVELGVELAEAVRE